MIELEEVVERVGIGFVGFELVEERDLTIDEALIAARQVDEEVTDALAEQLSLIVGDLDRRALNGVDYSASSQIWTARRTGGEGGNSGSSSPAAGLRIVSTRRGSWTFATDRAAVARRRKGPRDRTSDDAGGHDAEGECGQRHEHVRLHRGSASLACLRAAPPIWFPSPARPCDGRRDGDEIGERKTPRRDRALRARSAPRGPCFRLGAPRRTRDP